MVEIQKSQEIGIKFTTIDSSNFDKRFSGAHFVSFLFCYYCTVRMFGWGARIESLGTSLLLSSLLSIIRKGHFLSPVRLSLTPRGHLQYCIFLLYLAFWPWHRLLCFAKGPFMDYVSTFLGFLDPLPPTYIFNTENKKKLAISDARSTPKSAYVIYEWSPSNVSYI